MIAQLVQADEDTVRDVIHRFNEIGLARLDPRWAGGRPRRLSPDDEDFVVQTAITRPTKLGEPFARWPLRKLAAYLRRVHTRVIRPCLAPSTTSARPVHMAPSVPSPRPASGAGPTRVIGVLAARSASLAGDGGRPSPQASKR